MKIPEQQRTQLYLKYHVVDVVNHIQKPQTALHKHTEENKHTSSFDNTKILEIPKNKKPEKFRNDPYQTKLKSNY